MALRAISSLCRSRIDKGRPQPPSWRVFIDRIQEQMVSCEKAVSGRWQDVH